MHLSKQVFKDLKKAPAHVAIKLHSWIDEIIFCGLNKVKGITGYHDKPLKNDKLGRRVIRLDKVYRAVYVIETDQSIRFVEILQDD